MRENSLELRTFIFGVCAAKRRFFNLIGSQRQAMINLNLIKASFLPAASPLSAVSTLLFCFAGCGGDRAVVTGTVTYDGKPLPSSSLYFTSLNQGPGGTAVADANGYYEASMTMSKKWLVPGEYSVQIHSLADALDESGLSPSELTPALKKALGGVRLPAKYSDAKDTELTVTLTGGRNQFNFELVSVE